MIKILKYFLFIIFLLDFNLQVQAKPVPPGSGEGDVPANILFLIDSSASMSRRLSNRDAIRDVPNAIYDSNGDILVSQRTTLGVVKFNADGTRNREYNNNRTRFTGENPHTCSGFSNTSDTANYNPTTRSTQIRGTSKVRLLEKKFKKIQRKMIELMKGVHLNSPTIEALMESLYELNKKLFQGNKGR